MARMLTLALLGVVWLLPAESMAFDYDRAATVYGIAAGTVTATPAGSAATVTPSTTATPVPPTETPTQTPRSTMLILDQGGCAILPPSPATTPGAVDRRIGLGWLALGPFGAVWFVIQRRRKRHRRAQRSPGG